MEKIITKNTVTGNAMERLVNASQMYRIESRKWREYAKTACIRSAEILAERLENGKLEFNFSKSESKETLLKWIDTRSIIPVASGLNCEYLSVFQAELWNVEKFANRLSQYSYTRAGLVFTFTPRKSGVKISEKSVLTEFQEFSVETLAKYFK